MDPHGITEQDIATLIPRFYDRVRADPHLGPVFSTAISDWPHHLSKLVDFWSSVILTSGRYKGQPMRAHLRHAEVMTPFMFDRWLALWSEVTGDTLPAAKAQVFQATAARIAESLLLGVQFQSNKPTALVAIT